MNDRTESLLAQNATLALSLNWMRRQVEASRHEGYLPAGLLGETVRRERQEEVIEEQAREICLLTARLEERDAPVRRQMETAVEERDEVRRYVVELERRHLEALRSTSWRLTGPLRRVVRLMKGLPEPRFEPRYLDVAADNP